MKKLFNNIKEHKLLFTAIILIVIVNSAITIENMPMIHDVGFHTGRIVGLANCIRNGDFLGLIHDTLYGFGYATGLFYGNIFIYVPSILYLLGISLTLSYKIFILLITIATFIIGYLCFKSIIKDKNIALFGSILYTFSSYRLADVFIRGAIGEIIAFMILPVIMLGIYEIVYRDYKKWYLFTIGFVILVMNHLISTILIATFIGLFILFNLKKLLTEKKRLKYLLISTIVGVLLASFFIFPILEQYIVGDLNIFKAGSVYLPSQNTVNFVDMFFTLEFKNFHIGYALIITMLSRLIIKKEYVNKNKNLLKFADTLSIIGFICILSIDDYFPWQALDPILSFIQFPWRLLIITTVFWTTASIIYLYVLNSVKPKLTKKIIVTSLVIILTFTTILTFGCEFFKTKKPLIYAPEIGTGEYLPSGTNVDWFLENENRFFTNNKNLIYSYKRNGLILDIEYKNNLKENTYLEIPLLNYYGYYATDNIKIENGTNNVIKLNIEKESGNIKIYYKLTSVQKISYIISFVTLIGTTMYIIKQKKEKENGINK